MYHFIRFRSGYLTVTPPNSSPRYMCFKNRSDAKICKKYVADFRAKYGQWPNMDMNSSHIQIKLSAKKKRSPEHVEKFLEIETHEDFENFMDGVLYCHSFGVIYENSTKFTMSFSGQEIDFTFDTSNYIDNLNQRIDRSDL